MKIKGGIEPLLGDPNEHYNTIIPILLMKTSRYDFISTLKSSCIPIECKSLMHLLDWKEVLNIVDEYMDLIIKTWRKDIILEKESNIEPSNVNPTYFEDISDLKTLLQFTINLLGNCVQKDAYNSAEHLIELLHAYDDQLMFLAIECLLSLALPPFRHRSNLETHRHTTSIHKNVSYLEPLFDIVDSFYAVSNIHIQSFLSNSFQATSELNHISLNSIVKKDRSSKQDQNNLISSIKNIEDLRSPLNSFELTHVNELDGKSVHEILQNEASKLCFELKFPLMCIIRARRLLSTLEGRHNLIRLQYQAISIILGCHSDSSVLNGYFQDKVELIKNFIYLLRSGPGSLEYDPQLIALSTRLLACQSLEFIIGSRDSTCSPIFVRYPWILYDLGVNRGQYMGLFPCLLRSATSFLVAIDNKLDALTNTVTTIAEIDDSEEVQSRLLWIEQVFLLLISLVTCSTALPTLTENGLISSILIMMDRSDLRKRSDNLIFVEILTLEILECSVSNHTPAMNAFKDKCGLEIITNRLLRELQYCCQLVNIPVANSIMIQEIFSLLSATLLDNNGESTTTQQGQWYKDLSLVQSLQLIFSHSTLFDSLILSPAISLLADMISGDSAPPSILAHMISCDVVIYALAIVNCTANIEFTSDLCLSMISLISAVSLTSDGIDIVTKINPFPAMFSLFLQDKYIYPKSRLMMHGLPTDMGTNIEELIRHYPSYLTLCVAELMTVMEFLLNKATEFLNNDTNENLVFDKRFEVLMHHILAVLSCFDPLLLKKQTVQEFISREGIPLLLRFLKIALGPPRYVMTTLACIVDSTINSIGFVPLIRIVNSIISHIVELEPKAVFDVLMIEINLSFDLLSSSLLKLKASSEAEDIITNSDESSSNNFPLFRLLDTVTKQPLQDYCDNGILTPYLLLFSKVLASFTHLSYLFDMLGIILHPSSSAQTSLSSGKAVKLCINSLGSAKNIKILHRIINEVYIPSQLEMARARGSFVSCTKENCVKVHPIYHLIVIASENVIVKDSFEENALKVCKLGRGCKVDAYERKSTSGTNILKYRTKDGWISVFRSHMLPEPQILVLDISKKSDQEAEDELKQNIEIFDQPDKRSDFEKFANVSARRSGFLAMYHFNNAVKVNLLTVIANNIFTRDTQSLPEQMIVGTNAHSYLSILLKSIDNSIPDSSHFLSKNTIKNDFDCFLNNTKSVSFQENLWSESLVAEPSPTSQSNPLKDWMNKLLSQSIPKLDEFSSSQVYLTIRATDLSYLTLFENRRGKSELNPLVLLHMMQYEDKNLLDSLLFSTCLVFLCCLPDTELENTDLPDHHYLYDGPWSSIRDEQVDSIADNTTTTGQDVSTINSTSEMMLDDVNKLPLNASSTKFQSYVEYRRALRERRLLALSSIDNIIDVWKLICTSICLPITPTEKVLQAEANETHFYDPYSCKRKVMISLMRYLPLFWNHSRIHLFPPCTSKNIFDLMSTVIKTLNELKSFSNRAPIPSKPPKYMSSEDLHGPSGFMSSIMRPSRTLGAPHRVPSTASTAAAAAQPAPGFTVEEATLRSLEDMGFMRRTSMRAATVLHTNNVNQIVEYLFENPYLDDIPVAADPIPTIATTSSLQIPQEETIANTENNSEVLMQIESSSNLPQLLGNEIPINTSTLDEPVPASISLTDSTTNTDVTIKINALPLKDKVNESDLRKEKEVINKILRLCYNRVSTICLNLIEFGPSCDFKFLDSETKATNSGVTREVYTVMVLNQMMKCLDRSTFPDSMIRIIGLIWFYFRAIEILNQELTTERSIALYGILHSILVLLTTKTTSGPPSARVANSNELTLLIFTIDSRFNVLYSMLVKEIDKETKDIQTYYKGNQSLKDFDTNRVEWMAPALLILDIVIQPMLFDNQLLRDKLLDMEMYLNEHSSIVENDLIINGFGANEKIISDTLIKDINTKILNETIIKSKQKTKFFSELNPDNENIISETKPQTLPLRDECMEISLKLQCVDFSLRLLEVFDESSPLFYALIPQATMQLLVHLTRNPICRTHFHQLKGGSLVLRSNCSFEGLPAVTFTLLQQILEDERHLTQSITTAIRLCYLRLSKQKTTSVLLKNFIEVICPVIYRDQNLFMKTLQSCVAIKRISGQTFIELKDNVGVDATSAGEHKETITTAPTEAVQEHSSKKQRTNSGSSFQQGTIANDNELQIPTTTVASASHPRKRPFSETNNNVYNTNCDLAQKAIHSVYESVDELISLIFLKWIKIKSIGTVENWNKPDFDIQRNSMSIAELLMIVADLIASLPSFALCVHRYYINTSKLPAWALPIVAREYPVKHTLSGQPIGHLFISFVTHALLLPSKLESNSLLPNESPTVIAIAIEKLSGQVNTGMSSSQQLAASSSSANNTQTLQDACCYLIASLSSRPGEGRKRVLNELLNASSVGGVNSTTAEPISRLEQLHALVHLGEAVVNLLNPPARWSLRDAFVLPAKDILTTLVKLKAHSKLSFAVCCLDLEHPLSFDVSVLLSNPIEFLLRKGLAEQVVNQVTNILKETNKSTKDSIDTNTGVQRITNVLEAVPVATAPAEELQHVPQRETQMISSNTPNLLRTSLTSSILPPQDLITPNVTSTTTAIIHRDRVSFDVDETTDRLLMTNGSEILTSSSQHNHLMLPTGSQQLEDILEDHSSDEEDDDHHHGRTTEIEVDGFDEDQDHDDDDDDDEDDDEDIEEIGEVDDDEDEDDDEHDEHIEHHHHDDDDDDDDSDDDDDDHHHNHHHHDDANDDGVIPITIPGYHDDDEDEDVDEDIDDDDNDDDGDISEGDYDDEEADFEDEHDEIDFQEHEDSNENADFDEIEEAHENVVDDDDDDDVVEQDDTPMIDGYEDGFGANILNDGGESNLIHADLEGDDIDPDDVDNDNGTHNDDVDYDDGDEADGEDAINNENYWMRMGMGSISNSAVSGRVSSTGGMTPRITSARDFFTRARSHNESRSSRNRSSGIGGDESSHINPYADMAGFMSEIAGRAMIQSQGGLLMSGSGSNHRPSSSDPNDLNIPSRRFIFRTGNQDNAINGADLSANFQQLISTMLPSNIPISSSTARFDPRTGAVTLSFGNSRNLSADNALEEIPQYTSSTNGRNSSQSYVHPLLSVTDARRNRFLIPGTGGTAQSASSNFLMSSTGLPLRSIRSYVSELRDLGSSSSVLDSTNRQSRNSVSARRRAVGPIVSDRRWGTDMGDLEPAGARLVPLTSAIEHVLKDFIEREPVKESNATSRSRGGSLSNMNDKLNTKLSVNNSNLFGSLLNFSAFGDHQDNVEMTSPPVLGADNEDSYFEEAEEDEEDDDGNDYEEVEGDEAAAGGYDHHEQEESKEEGVLQETKEGEIIDTARASSHQFNTTNHTATSSQELPSIESHNNPIISETVTNDASTTTVMEETTTSVPAAALIESDTLNVSEENVQFIESLPPDLRREVLITAEDVFLRSLPLHMQQEAQQLLDQQALEIQLSTYESQANVTSEVVNHSDARLNTVTSLDIGTIMDDIRLLSSNSNEQSNIIQENNIESTEQSNNLIVPEVREVPTEANSFTTTAATTTAAATTMSGANEINGFTEVLSRLYTASSAAFEAQNTAEEINNPFRPIATPTSASAMIETIAIKEAKHAAEVAMSVSLSEDRLVSALPYNSHLVSRLLVCLLSAKKTKLPRAILKLLTTVCRYKKGRTWILRAMFCSLIREGEKVLDCVREIPIEVEGDSISELSAPLFETELSHLREAVMNPNPLNIRKILCAISFLLRKTEKLVWYDIMARPCVAIEDNRQIWMFGALLSLLGTPIYASSVNLEFILQVLEELCSPLSKLTVQQANELALDSIASMNIKQSSNNSDSKSKLVKAPLDTVYEEDEDEGESNKRRRVENSTSVVEVSVDSNDSNTMNVVSTDVGSAVAEESTIIASSYGDSNLVRMPFPVLQDFEARILCDIAGSLDCGGASRKRLMKIMRVLSLYDGNWLLFLQHLSTVGADFASKAVIEFSNLHNTLVEVVQNQESAVVAMSRPELSSPRNLSEVRLLNVLRLMTVLRARGSVVAASESETVAQYIRKIQCLKLWENLFECLDIVRDLEGIKDFEEDEDIAKNSNSVKNSNESEKKVTLSSLTMRFMPLIECFLTVCSTTLLIKPAPHNETTTNDNMIMTSGIKRRYDHEELTSPAASTTTTTAVAAVNKHNIGLPSPFGNHSTTTPGGTGGSMNRVHSMLPGSRFRQSASYFQMQMELSDEAAAARLILFTKQNRILFNQVLRNNIQLLETSFSPLVNVPKCRQLLHFDIKRSYFRMRLKRMRQTSARMHGSLRLSVRRSRVFEESFQSLRYKTADEMRRKLSVNFHGEEGMDAGGLTREWYSVLARDIFNADYALFISSGDNVTFQPNTQSYINEDHLLYFKFVGRVIGKAICDGHLLDAHFTRSFYKHILGQPVSVGDLEAIEPDYYKSLQQILNTPLDQLGLDLTFSAESNEFGQVSTIDLIPQGRDIFVTDETKYEYIKLLAHHRMTSAIRKQIDSFLEGFHDLVPPELISIFDAQELELLISGLPDIDLDDLRAHTDYHSYKPTDPEITWFWNVLKSFSKQEKALFLQFVTGTSKVPLDGFQALQGSDGLKRFNIHKSFTGSHQLPSAHTCFNQLDLPQYPSEEITREKLLIAIREGSEGFGFA